MKKLWICDAPVTFDPETDILLGPWCIDEKGIEYSEINNFNFPPDPSSSIHEMKIDEEITKNFADSYLSILTEKYNRLLGTDYSSKFWRIIIMPWLLTLCQSTWLKQKIINDFIEKNKNDSIEVDLIENSVKWNFKDTYDFIYNGIQSKNYNHWLYSRLMEYRLPPKWKVNYIKLENKEFKKVTQESLKVKIYNYLVLLFPIISIKGMPIIKGIILELLLFIKNIFRLNKQKSTIKKFNIKKVEIDWKLDWEDLIEKTSPNSFFTIKKQNLKKITNTYRIECGSNLFYNEAVKYKIAIQFERGVNLILSQHGGVYGTASVHSLVNSLEYYVADKYLSWGWKSLSYNKNSIYPIPSPYLSKFKYKRENDKIIFVDGVKNIFHKRINSVPQPNDCYNQRDFNYLFIKNLKKNILNEFYYRPALSYSGGGKIIDSSYCQYFYPNLKIIKGDLHTESMKCKILIVDGPNTTFSIALSSNIPVIAFWDPLSNAIDENALPLFNELKKFGIVHENPKSAADHLNFVYNDIDAWWNNPNLQKSRENWINNFANKDENWFKYWFNLILEL
jgi:putative transferase (TIGR04331 family)